MEKILNTAGLGVSGRQNELIELALTFQFNTVQVDMNDLIGRHDTMGKEFACQFLKSAKINIGAFELPVNLDSSDEDFAKGCKKLETIFSLCETLQGKRCRIPIATSSDEPFQVNFERHRSRLFELGEEFAAHGMSIGLMLKSPGTKEKSNKFICTAEEILTLVKTVGHANVGLCLDTWQWRISGGGMDQISDIDFTKVTELMMADVSKKADPEKYSAADRVIPGEYDKSFSLDVYKHLTAAGYEGPVSLATHAINFANATRDRIVHRISQTLDRMIAGQPLDLPVATFPKPPVGDETEAESKDVDEAVDSSDDVPVGSETGRNGSAPGKLASTKK